MQDKENIRPVPRPSQPSHKPFEDAIRDYRGADPLSPHWDYVQWLQKTYEKNEKESRKHLLPVLDTCLKRFQDDPAYQNNKKYLRLWLIYADLTENSEDVFRRLSEKGIGRKLAMYYQGFALLKEHQGQLDLAEKLYEEGLRLQADPVSALQESYQAFKREHPQRHKVSPKRVLEQSDTSVAKRVAIEAEARHEIESKKGPPEADADITDWVPGYSKDVIVHPNTAEEICFEEYRAMWCSRQEVEMDPVEEEAAPLNAISEPTTYDVSEIIRQTASIGSAMLNSPDGTRDPLQSFLSGGATPSVSSRMKQASTPTVHTRAALEIAYGMYKDSPAFVSSSLTDEIGEGENERVPSPLLRPKCSPIAFTVFSDAPTARLDTTIDSKAETPAPPSKSLALETPAPLEAQSTNPDLTPILETSREDEDGDVLDPFDPRHSARLSEQLNILSLPGVRDDSAVAKPFDLQSVLDGSEGDDFELGEHLFHLDVAKAPVRNSENVATLWVQDLDQENGSDNMVLTVGTGASASSCQWEYYIAHVLKQRASDSKLLVLPHQLFVFNGMSCLLARRLDHTLQDVLVAYQRAGKAMPEVVAWFYSMELLRVLEVVHGCDILHCAIGPQNLAIRHESTAVWDDWKDGWDSKGLALRDWSWAVDMRFYPHSRFRTNRLPRVFNVVSRDASNQAWTKEVDRWQAVCVMLTMLGVHPDWTVQESGRRVWSGLGPDCRREMWGRVFDELLNTEIPVRDVRLFLARALSQDPERLKAVKTALCQQTILLCE